MENKNICSHYPTKTEIDEWVDRLWDASFRMPCEAISMHTACIHNACGAMHMNRTTLLRFTQPGMRPFYGMWSRAMNGPRPLVVHLPGYGSELSTHLDLAAENYNLLELVPMGYWTPEGFDESLRHPKTGTWPVLTQSVVSPYENEGYWGWMLNAVGAIKWALAQPSVLPERVSFFGTSQGGGTALLLGSIFRDHGTRCVCADEPFLTNYPMSTFRGAYDCIRAGFENTDEAQGWKNLGFVDTVCHAHRMEYPVLLTLGTADVVCPPETIQTLYDRLETDKMLFSMRGRGHGHQFEFVRHVSTYLELYA
ncbi:MAG: acetylxylan esterase [Clostridia bacterium]|nr:acetylxylan esterase [Clostridia bacterium]